jgi:hypothetical protein
MENLHQLTGRLANNFLPVAVSNHSFFINDIPADLSVAHNREWVASVVGSLLCTVVHNVKDTCIRLSAKKYGHVIILEIQESGSTNTFTMASELQQVYSLAERIGGNLSIGLRRPEITTITFSFPNLPLAA